MYEREEEEEEVKEEGVEEEEGEVEEVENRNAAPDRLCCTVSDSP